MNKCYQQLNTNCLFELKYLKECHFSCCHHQLVLLHTDSNFIVSFARPASYYDPITKLVRKSRRSLNQTLRQWHISCNKVDDEVITVSSLPLRFQIAQRCHFIAELRFRVTPGSLWDLQSLWQIKPGTPSTWDNLANRSLEDWKVLSSQTKPGRTPS